MLVLTPPTDNGGETITYYEVTVTPGDISITTTMTSLLVSDLTPLTEYTFTVRANNTVGYSNYNDTVCTTLKTKGNDYDFIKTIVLVDYQSLLAILFLIIHYTILLDVAIRV